MADILDVQNALAALAQNAIYPLGINSPSIINKNVRIYPGWPIPGTLDSDLANLTSHVSIFPTTISRPSTRFDTQWLTNNINTATLTLTISDSQTTITVSGTVTTPQTILIKLNGYDYYYSVQSNDTLESIAQNISLLVPGAYSDGNMIIFVIVRQIQINISTYGTASQELAREKRLIYLTVWSPTPQMRETLVAALAVGIGANYRMPLLDGYYAMIRFVGSRDRDTLEKVRCYRGDVFIMVDYAITNTGYDYTVAQNIVDVNSEVTPQILFQLLSGGNFLLLNTQNLGLLE
jgi:hypothetical protein